MKHIVIIFVCISLLSCKRERNDDNIVPETGTYSPYGVLHVSSLRMLVKDKEITDQAFIIDYIKKIGLEHIFINTSTEPITDKMSKLLIDWQSDTAIIIKNSVGDVVQCKKELVKDDEISLKMKDSVGYLSSKDINAPCYRLEKAIFKYGDGETCTYGMGGGLSQINLCLALRRYTLVREEKQFYIPLITYTGKYRSNCRITGQNAWNILNGNLSKELTTEDTVVVQTKKMFIEREN